MADDLAYEVEVGHRLGRSIRGVVVHVRSDGKLHMGDSVDVLASVRFVRLPPKSVVLDLYGRKASNRTGMVFWISATGRNETRILVEAKKLPLEKK